MMTTRDEARATAERRILNGARAYNLARPTNPNHVRMPARIWFEALETFPEGGELVESAA